VSLSGNLGCLDPAWRGWVLRAGKLISPEGWEATPQDVLSLPSLRAQLAMYRADSVLAEDDQQVPGSVSPVPA